MKEKNLNIIKIIAIVIILLISIFSVRKFSLEEIRSIIQSYGALGPLVYIILFAILPIFLFPVPLLVLPAGAVFGLFYGTVYTVIGVIINSALMYYLSKFLAAGFVEKFMNEKLSVSMKKRLLSDNQKTLSSVFFMLRLVPLVSYNLINYIAGLTKIKILNYLLVTLIAVVPGTIIFINAGDKALDVKSHEFKVALALLIALMLISALLLKLYLKRGSDGNNNNSNME